MTKRNTYTYLSQSDIAIQIERLVQATEQHDSPAFRFRQTRTGYERVEETRLSRYFTHIRQMMDLFDDRVEYRYSEHLQAFREACQDIGLERHPDGPVCRDESGTAWLDHHHSMNVLVARIRQLTRERWYLRRKDDLRLQAKKQEGSVTDYVDAVLDRYSRTTIVRVNLYYRSEAQARLRVEHVFDDLDRLIAERERNPIFDHLTGYICAVEQGEGRGYHVHAAFFFNGNEVRGDIYKAKQIGELWERITRGQGYFNSCNHNKEKYGNRRGIGIILRSDRNIRPHVHDAVRYLVKDDQQLRMKPLRGKCLRKGLPR
ncbi:inovirus Gp2 family protein [Pseudomonas sp. TNT2022 ID1044]|uniref:YagK/YfjJ domain-containing protein n=1 Tax=Pseudomonas sp. TNT2022 ID1044 TaxID=2942636 RepID=UPI00235E9FEA|nr:inovirus-type Gp2 protein [Pseudomonas sp. TNT2022 ID1044]MDD0996650.1 inovirus Gp2 family protein [Pseudomonas sp. TNT2022 ID1044]